MVLGGIAAHDQDAIAVLEIVVMIGHGTTAERLCQSRNTGTVSDPGLMVHLHEAQGPHHRDQPALLIVELGAAHVSEASTRLITWPLSFLTIKPLSRGALIFLAISVRAQSSVLGSHLSPPGSVENLGQTILVAAAASGRSRTLRAQ